MKKFIQIYLIVAMLLSFPPVGFSSYLIQLKNGGHLLTTHHWEEGNQIMFYYYNGIAGVSKDAVSQIKTTSPDTKIEPILPIKPIQQKEVAEKSQTVTTPAKSETKPASPSSADKTKDDQFLKEFELIMERAQGLQNMSKEELVQFVNDLTVLRKKIVSSGVAQHYNDQLQKMYAAIDEVKAIFKARGQ